jgi:hypothetical protein
MIAVPKERITIANLRNTSSDLYSGADKSTNKNWIMRMLGPNATRTKNKALMNTLINMDAILINCSLIE